MSGIKITEQFNKKAEVILFHGNTLDLLHTVPDNFVNLVITSPPYNIGKQYECKSTLDKYTAFQKKVIEECVRVLHKEGSICWQVGNYVNNGHIIPLDMLLYPIFTSLGLVLRNRIVWSFGHGLHSSKRFSGRYEVILWFTKTDKYVFNLDPIRIPQKYPQKKYFKGPKKGQLSGNPLGKNPGDVWEIPNVKANHVEKTAHPCQFPIELVERLVLSMTNEGDWVLDPFIGVGSTAVAALMHKRRVLGAEIKEDYLDIARKRINLAEQGILRIRPMERNVYDPGLTKNLVPPKLVHLNPFQSRLFQKKAIYSAKENNK